ncbi:hypothetical protein COBT_002249 [Conglomerata obtusa]
MLNKTLNYDMASASASLREYKGAEAEDPTSWVREFKMVVETCGLNTCSARNLLFLKLRDKAQAWGAQIYEKYPAINLEQLVQLFLTRFQCIKHNHEITERFFNKNAVKSKADFIQLIQDATHINLRKEIKTETLMKFVISKTPAELRTLMFQIAYENSDWEDFIRRTEEIMWIPFPEIIVDMNNNTEARIIEIRENKYKKKAIFKVKNFIVNCMENVITRQRDAVSCKE